MVIAGCHQSYLGVEETEVQEQLSGLLRVNEH